MSITYTLYYFDLILYTCTSYLNYLSFIIKRLSLIYPPRLDLTTFTLDFPPRRCEGQHTNSILTLFFTVIILKYILSLCKITKWSYLMTTLEGVYDERIGAIKGYHQTSC